MHHHYYLLDYLHNRELDSLYLFIALKSFSLSMITIFVPIYLIKLSFSLSEIFLFYIIINVCHALSTFPAGKFVAKLGFKHTIFFSMPMMVAYYLSLFALVDYPQLLYAAAIIYGISRGFFFVGFHIDFAKATKKGLVGRQIGLGLIISNVFTLAGPIIGGIISSVYGFNWLFIVVSSLFFLSMIPLLSTPDTHVSFKLSFAQIFRQKIKDFFLYLGFGMDRKAAMILWPIIIYLFITVNLTSIGLITTFALLGGIITTIIVGKLSDEHKRALFRFGGAANAIIWVFRSVATTAGHIFIINFFGGMTEKSTQVPTDALSYDRMKRKNPVQYVIFREFMIQMGGVVLFTIMYFVQELLSTFVLGGGASLLYMAF